MSGRPEDALTGSWRLDSYLTEHADGSFGEGPLGPAPSGVLVYAADGWMSVGMMRTDAPADAVNRFMGYAGGWRLTGDRVLHRVAVASHAYLVGTEQVREFVLDGDVLTLSGTAGVAGAPPERRVLTWSRVEGGAR